MIDKSYDESKYLVIQGLLGNHVNGRSLQDAINDIDQRLELLENRLFKTERKSSTTRSQQMLLLLHLGVLDKLNEFNISNKKKAKLLSVLLNASQDNIEGDLSAIYKKDSYLRSSINYEVVSKTFKDAGIKELAEDTDKILDQLNQQSNK
jgi:hypothetical protein